MKSICKKILPIILILAFVITMSACDLDKFWGYVTGEGIGDFDGANDNSDVVYNQGTLTQSNNPLADTIESLLPTVVDVTCTATYLSNYNQSTLAKLTGSGVIIDQDQQYLYIICSYQTVSFESTVTGKNNVQYHLNSVQPSVTFMDGKVASAVFVALIANADTGLLRVKKADITSYAVATLPTTQNTIVGQDIIAVSNPLGVLGGTVTTGIVSAERQMDNVEHFAHLTTKVIQTDAELTVNSGGILFTTDGKFIGVVYAKAVGTGIEGINFAVPASSIIDAYHKKGLLTNVKVGE